MRAALGPLCHRFLAAPSRVSFALLALVLLTPTSASSRMQPYYLLRGVGLDAIEPRILFVLDTSDSMIQGAQNASALLCSFRGCEVPDHPEESRISVARRALHDVVSSLEGRAQFGLMTFDQEPPPAPTAIPEKCNLTSGAKWRFNWMQQSRAGGTSNGTQVDRIIDLHPGIDGTWTICAGKQANGVVHKLPFPYLRWDNLGVGSVINARTSTGAVPPSPLIDTSPTSFRDFANGQRKVQFFPRFLGVRARLDASTDPDESLLLATVGDYGTSANVAGLRAEVKDHDFYYWPYVDGFPGYASWRGLKDPAHTYYADPWFTLGVRRGRGVMAANLYAPFHLDPASLANPVPAGLEGPASRTAATQVVLDATARLIEGGVDVHHGGATPWASTIGDAAGPVVQDNRQLTHDSVASYLRFINDAAPIDLCAPMVVVVVTDGFPWPNTEGGPVLYQRLADLRRVFNAKTYVVGIFQNPPGVINEMACAAAGAWQCGGTSGCLSPCDYTPVDGWDTCKDPNDPHGECAFMASSHSELVDALKRIVNGEVELELAAGPATVRNEDVGGLSSRLLQTSLRAYTEWPGWKGHVVRDACEDPDPANPAQLAAHCADPDQFEGLDATAPTFGPCPRSRTWDAGECLAQTAWNARKIYFRRASGERWPILTADGTGVFGAFTNELVAQGLIPNDTNKTATALAIGQFLHGKDWPQGWKLPGLGRSTPAFVARVPQYQRHEHPSVPIRDPHCAGKNVALAQGDVPVSLQNFAKDSWDPTKRVGNPAHLPYQDVVLVGDDLGLLHAFHAASGNEMWALLPTALLPTVVEQYHRGVENRGQPEDLDDHSYGVGSSVNHGWVYDHSAAKWRHLAVFGFGAGGRHYYALDVSHASPNAAGGPFDILWTTEDSTLAPQYAPYLGETWARPALTYEVPGHSMANEPHAYLVLTSGYSATLSNQDEGLTMMLVDAVTGQVLERANAAASRSSTVRFDTQDFGLVVDPVVGSHCKSRLWPEMEEVYVTDPVGRLYRWDLGSSGGGRPHLSDSVNVWSQNGDVAGMLGRFWACKGAGQNCSIAVGGANGGLREPFNFAPAVSAIGRIDPFGGGATAPTPREDEFLIAMISGSADDDTLDGTEATNIFHSSLYLLVDNHRNSRHYGLSIPSGSPRLYGNQFGDYSRYLRVVVSDMWRRRRYTPYPNHPTCNPCEEVRRFSKGTRPIRSPRIQVRAAVDSEGDLIAGQEVYDVTYTVYEPGDNSCDPIWYDASAKRWHYDEGAVYEVRFRLPVDVNRGFDFTAGANDPNTFGDQGITYLSAEQVTDGECADGNCAPTLTAPRNRPCYAGLEHAPEEPPHRTLSIATAPVGGFAAVE